MFFLIISLAAVQLSTAPSSWKNQFTAEPVLSEAEGGTENAKVKSF